MKLVSNLANLLVAGGIVAATMASANATPVIGTANLTFGLVAVSLGEIDWNPPLNPGFDATPTYGAFTTPGFANTGSFAAGPMAGITTGSIHDMSANPADANYFPVGIPSMVAKYLIFNAQPGWLFTGTFLSPGDQGPYTLTEVGGNVSATISVHGTVCDSGDGICDPGESLTNFTAILSAQYTNATIASLTAILLGGGTLPNNTWSGTVEATAIPEPTSIALFGLALVGLGALRRRKA